MAVMQKGDLVAAPADIHGTIAESCELPAAGGVVGRPQVERAARSLRKNAAKAPFAPRGEVGPTRCERR